MKDVFDDELQSYYESLGDQKYCLNCEQPIDSNKEFCSYQCYNA